MSTRLNKFLAEAGIASRRKSEIFIADGRVRINGTVANSPGIQIHTTDVVTVDGKNVYAAEETRLWCYYKPVGLVCTHEDPQGRDTVFDALPKKLGRVISVGRLDLNSEGVLLLTNNGDLARRLEHPESALERIYKVRVRGMPSTATLKAIQSGITIDGIAYRPANVELHSNKKMSNYWLTVTLREGKNREIRRIFEHFGHPVNRLIRLSYGDFVIDNMLPNEVREISQSVLKRHGYI